MIGICQKCKTEQMVHRASWQRGYVPKCRECGDPLEPNANAIRMVRSRMRSAIMRGNVGGGKRRTSES